MREQYNKKTSELVPSDLGKEYPPLANTLIDNYSLQRLLSFKQQ